MAIQMRRGQLANYDKSKMLPGEWGISIDNDSDNQKAFISFAPGVSKEVMMVEDAEEQIAVATAEAIDMATEEAEAWAHGNSFHVNDYASGDGSTKSFTLAETPSSIIGVYVDGSSVSAYTLSEKTITFTTAPASGSNNIRVYYTVNTTTDNAKYYKEQAEAVAESIPEDYTELSEDVDQLKNALTAVEIVDTASGAIASFADGSDGVPVKGLKVQMEPIQAGSGDPSPSNIRPISGRTAVTVTRTGVNKFDGEWSDPVGGYYNAVNFMPVTEGESYYVYAPLIPANESVYAITYDADKNLINNGQRIGRNSVFTVPSGISFIKLKLWREFDTADISFNYPSTDHDYHAGHVQTVEIPLGQTVYGGTLDVTQGVLTVTMAEVDLGTLSYSFIETRNIFSAPLPFAPSNVLGGRNNAMCEKYTLAKNNISYTNFITMDKVFKYSLSGFSEDVRVIIRDTSYTDADTFKAAMDGVQLAYELATPVTVQLTAQQMTTLLGQNNVWSDADSVAVDYVADTKLYIEQLTEPDADMVADMNITSGKYFMVGNSLYLATANIANGANIIVGVNCTRTSLAEALNAINA